MGHVFISHATADDPFVADLRRALEALKLTVWVDSRNLRGGAKLQPEIEQAIFEARQVIVVLSLQTVNSPWVRREIRYALDVEQQRKDDGYRVIPLLLPGMTPRALENWFEVEPLAVPIELTPGSLSEALPAILAALGERLPTDKEPARVPVPAPVDELILQLRDPTMTRRGGTRRARASATLVFQPADPAAQRSIESRRFSFTAPLGPVELEEIRWYLEDYHLWPVGVFHERAERTEKALPAWGQALYTAALGADAAREAVDAWRTAQSGTRRFSVLVDRDAPEGAREARQAAADEAASQLLSLPWELLHDEIGYLLHGRRAAHVRRQLPNREPQARQLARLPIRILLLSPRPELDEEGQETVGYFDHRSSALPLVGAVEALGELAQVTVLTPPTLPALEAELSRAQAAGKPYAVVHFDGHGVYDRQQGLGALVFEAASEAGVPGKRHMELVYADGLAGVMRDYGVPLVFLDACQTAQVAADPTTSVAAKLLEQGVTSVVAMSHSVLVETARRFVQAFYRALAEGGRVGEAMRAGQQALAGDPARGKVMGAGELRLQDWFVPVLYQEPADPQLFATLPSGAARALTQQGRKLALGALPETPEHTFVGRSHELLALERLLASEPYVVVRGSGGAGKTTIAVELARWLVRSGRFGRAAFLSLEQFQDARGALDSLGHQLLPDGERYSVTQFASLAEALQPVERALRDEATIIVVDNVESALPLPGDHGAEAPELLAFCQKLLAADPRTRLVFTSRERLPAPFARGAVTCELGALDSRDAVQLVERVMANAGWTPPAGDAGATPEEVAALVEAAGCRARALVLLAPEVARLGVRAATGDLQRLMAELDRKHPGERENSLYASVELSLRRLPEAMRAQVAALAVCCGGGHLYALGHVMGVEADQARQIAIALIEVGLGEDMGDGYLRLDPALPPYLAQGLAAGQLESLGGRWAEAMQALATFLYKQRFKDTHLAARLTLLELPNLLALLDWLPGRLPAEEIVDVAGSIEGLLQDLARPGALARAVAVRAAARELGEWGPAGFQSECLRIERLLDAGDLRAALAAAEALQARSLAAGEDAYEGAAYDIAMAHDLLGRALPMSGQAGAALAPLAEAQRRFETLAEGGDAGAARMASASITKQADCLRVQGRLEEAAAGYEEAIRRDKQRDDSRDVAVDNAQLGTVRRLQGRNDEALAAHTEARAIFERLGEPGSVATAWHGIGMVHTEARRFEAAERALRQALALEVQHSLRASEAASLNELGNLYDAMGRPEEAVAFTHRAADIYVALGDLAGEGRARSNAAGTLLKLGRHDEAREEVLRAIECDEPFGHAAEPWKSWDILHRIEQVRGDGAAAGDAWRRARDSYLAYRREGGYAQNPGGQLCGQLLERMQSGQSSAARQALAEIGQAADAASWLRALLLPLKAILDGSRNPALADDPALDYDDAAEVALLLERPEAG